MGWMPKNGEPIKLNGAFYMGSSIMRFVVASASEAELGALFHNCHRSNKSHKTKDGQEYTVIGLSGMQPRCQSEISCVRYGNEHPFGRVLPVRSRGTKSSMWTFLHGMDA